MTERTQHTEENIQRLQTFFENELSVWQDARQRFEDLSRVQVREMDVDGLQLSLQFNPARMVSTGAKIDREALQRRPCFLCAENRPQVQTQLPLNDDFCLLVNPFPILPQHFTLPAKRHQPQLIRQHYGLLHELLSHYPHLLAFYNGPKCGASAPDHLHFQAGTSGLLPLQRDWARLYERRKTLLCFDDGELSAITTFVVPAFAIRSRSALTDARLFNRLYEVLPQREGEPEPMLNILAWREGEDFLSVVIPREKHRPDCYSAQGEEQFLVSPGALDMGGLLITPRQEDFHRLTPERVAALYHEVGMQLQDFNTVKEQLCSSGECDASASSELRLSSLAHRRRRTGVIHHRPTTRRTERRTHPLERAFLCRALVRPHRPARLVLVAQRHHWRELPLGAAANTDLHREVAARRGRREDLRHQPPLGRGLSHKRYLERDERHLEPRATQSARRDFAQLATLADGESGQDPTSLHLPGKRGRANQMVRP